MIEIYDIVLNFCDAEKEMYEFYEWSKNDNLSYINKIPIISINSFQMAEIISNIIKVDKSLLLRINNKTISDNKNISYCLLVTDNNKVIALKFSKEGILEKKSSLLLDEEEAVIEESKDNELEYLEYSIIKKNNKQLFLTRKEKRIRLFLLKKITELYYKNKAYDEIDYLYHEINSQKQSIKSEYEYLINMIKNDYRTEYNKLYDIIKLAVNNKKSCT